MIIIICNDLKYLRTKKNLVELDLLKNKHIHERFLIEILKMEKIFSGEENQQYIYELIIVEESSHRTITDRLS